MKLIFLDIDGVLNHYLYYEKINYDEINYPYSEFDPEKIELLNTLIKNTGAEVVVSSTWRKNIQKEELEKIMQKRGFKYTILDFTPELNYTGNYGTVPRGCEILAWINENIKFNSRDSLKYVIFDDDSDMFLWQRESYFQVDGYCGLTPNIIYRAERFLNRGE
jgi:hypothetical protein